MFGFYFAIGFSSQMVQEATKFLADNGLTMEATNYESKAELLATAYKRGFRF